jgi:hypothetical protein
MAPRKNPEIIIAVIGLTGVLATGAFSNWDKVFPDESKIQVDVAGYRPTGSFETELRYYFEVAGLRQMMADMQKELTANMRANLITQHPENVQEIQATFATLEEEAIRFEDIVAKFLPVYQKHFTIAEIQNLNKFYSTETMQTMIRKQPLLMRDAAPIQVQMMQEYQSRILPKIVERLDHK